MPKYKNPENEKYLNPGGMHYTKTDEDNEE